MSINPQEVKQEEQLQDQPRNDKEYNFAQLRKQMESERSARLKLEKELEEVRSKSQSRAAVSDEDDNYDEPYIDKRYLKKNLDKTGLQIREEVRRETQAEMQKLFQEEKRNSWLKSNPDFQEVMQHAQKFAETDPELAETILEMPEGFERQKLVYKNIKALGLHKPAVPKESIQDKVDKNRKGPYYQPSQMGTAPYGVVNGGKDYSPAEGKSAYDHMKALQQKLRLN
jgi:hypothetical protein